MNNRINIYSYKRQPSSVAQVGGIRIGGDEPIRVQSMTTTPTKDTEASAAQVLRIAAAGGELVRLTTQGKAEAENMRNINAAVRDAGCMVPLVADVHFNPAVAKVAAQYCEKVRINPGNFIHSGSHNRNIDWTEEECKAEVDQIAQVFMPILNICREHGTAIRIGVNHGSLSDRIMHQYGDTPEGIVESCMEFLRLCKQANFPNVMVSIKSSNTAVMVASVRLLVWTMVQENMCYPIHLGVTEAGEGEDGRIKSAVGIGAMLQDGIGDTIRVSLSEEPEAEIPVARQLVQYVTTYRSQENLPIPYSLIKPHHFNWLRPQRRTTTQVGEIGGGQPPVVLEQIPLSNAVVLNPFTFDEDTKKFLQNHPGAIVVSSPRTANRLGEHRALAIEMMNCELQNPLLLHQEYAEDDIATLQLKAAADTGILFIDKLGDGLIIENHSEKISLEEVRSLSYSILQAAQARFTKTEYISCPGCGRTLYNLQDTIAKIKAATSHLKAMKIAIMGCIVNGPGEMADADYGYVGAARGCISLYRGKECVERNIPQEEAVERLLALIEADQELKNNNKK